MIFHSPQYVFCFLPVVFFLYYLTHRTSRLTLQNAVFLAASYLFYSWGRPELLILIIISSLIDYRVALALDQTEHPGKRKGMLAISLVTNLGMLAFFKYGRWLTTLANQFCLARNLPFVVPVLEIPLPPGISFYTFQALSYTIDVYRRGIPAKKNAIHFFTYIAFFPQLIAGPIERASSLLTQLTKPRAWITLRQFEHAIFLIFFGIMKKTVFADNLGHVVSGCLGRLEAVPGIGFVAVFAFCFQIYFDFSAYTDIARGSAALFNVELTYNFKTPYFAVSPSDFWKRWHITLSRWLRDYLYIPLGGNRKGRVRTVFNLLAVMTLGGLWHGAGFCFLLWGIYHGLLLIFYRFLPLDEILVKYGKRGGRLLAMGLMFVLTNIGWMIFMSHSPGMLQGLLQNMGSGFTAAAFQPFTVWLYPALLFSLPFLPLEIAGYLNGCEFVELHKKWPAPVKVAVYYVMFYLIVFMAKREGYDFIYFAFKILLDLGRPDSSYRGLSLESKWPPQPLLESFISSQLPESRELRILHHDREIRESHERAGHRRFGRGQRRALRD